jgi:hypothetical protein
MLKTGIRYFAEIFSNLLPLDSQSKGEHLDFYGYQYLGPQL